MTSEIQPVVLSGRIVEGLLAGEDCLVTVRRKAEPGAALWVREAAKYLGLDEWFRTVMVYHASPDLKFAFPRVHEVEEWPEGKVISPVALPRKLSRLVLIVLKVAVGEGEWFCTVRVGPACYVCRGGLEPQTWQSGDAMTTRLVCPHCGASEPIVRWRWT